MEDRNVVVCLFRKQSYSRIGASGTGLGGGLGRVSFRMAWSSSLNTSSVPSLVVVPIIFSRTSSMSFCLSVTSSTRFSTSSSVTPVSGIASNVSFFILYSCFTEDACSSVSIWLRSTFSWFSAFSFSFIVVWFSLFMRSFASSLLPSVISFLHAFFSSKIYASARDDAPTFCSHSSSFFW